MSFTYRGLKATLEHHTVTATEIAHQLDRLRQQTPRIAPVTDRPAQAGDEVVLDYAGYCDGVQFAGGTAQGQTLVLGSGTFIPGFEEQLIDKVPGEPVSVQVTFPAQYHAPELAGKAAEFKCTIQQIRIKSAYELDDTFAKEVGGCETMEEMRAKMGQSLQAYSDERGEMDLQDRLLRQAAETLEFTPNENQIKAEVERLMENLSSQLAMQGLSLEMYCSFMSTSEEKLREDARENAIASIRAQATVEQVAAAENLDVSQDEIGEAIALVARQNNMTVEDLMPHYDTGLRAAVIRSVLTSKVMQLIRNAAEITEITE